MGGKLKNCPYCGKLFLDVGRGVCPRCEETLDMERQFVREYIEQHPGADLREVASGTGLPVKRLTKMKRDGFLADRRSMVPHPCHSCGKPTYDGMFCNACVAAFAKRRSEIAHHHLAENLKGVRVPLRKPELGFFSRTYKKYSREEALPLLKSDRLKLKKQREKERRGAFFTNFGGENR